MEKVFKKWSIMLFGRQSCRASLGGKHGFASKLNLLPPKAKIYHPQELSICI